MFSKTPGSPQSTVWESLPYILKCKGHTISVCFGVACLAFAWPCGSPAVTSCRAFNWSHLRLGWILFSLWGQRGATNVNPCSVWVLALLRCRLWALCALCNVPLSNFERHPEKVDCCLRIKLELWQPESLIMGLLLSPKEKFEKIWMWEREAVMLGGGAGCGYLMLFYKHNTPSQYMIGFCCLVNWWLLHIALNTRLAGFWKTLPDNH